MSVHKFNLILVGEGGVGKRSLVQRFATGKTITFQTTSGKIIFNVSIVDQYQLHAGTADSSFRWADCAIIMFDHSSRVTGKKIPEWAREISRESPGIPIVLCGNKVDITGGNVQSPSPALECCGISVKTDYNLKKPFLLLSRMCTGNSNLEFCH
ncbi:hypothetical protein DASC09_048820 [Saccharomycopsis crataegensis]|uniref:Uncharacterized protein n=1 Tax=Saccharomycopsis crataegensis TaxID=43959 RepID=A0AAV5QRN9_9ASCO|nr:hypothetical protein DASC09_048820 [Saccharomycopsis crataegensis]